MKGENLEVMPNANIVNNNQTLGENNTDHLDNQEIQVFDETLKDFVSSESNENQEKDLDNQELNDNVTEAHINSPMSEITLTQTIGSCIVNFFF